MGPPLGGFLADHADWRWIFYINLPLGLAALTLAFVLVPDTAGEAVEPFDWTGFVLTAGGLFCLLAAAECLSTPPMPILLASALGTAGIFLTWMLLRHLRRAAHPLVDLSTMRLPTFSVTIVDGSLFRIGISAIPFLLPLMLQTTFGYCAFEAGVMLMVVFAGMPHAMSIAGSAAITPELPPAAIYTLLFFTGTVRSLQFTALGTIAFSDVSQPAMIAVVAGIAVIDSYKLRPDAGRALSRRDAEERRD